MCVFQLRTVTGNEFLLQSETESLINDWYKTIQNVIDRLVRLRPKLEYIYIYLNTLKTTVELGGPPRIVKIHWTTSFCTL